MIVVKGGKVKCYVSCYCTEAKDAKVMGSWMERAREMAGLLGKAKCRNVGVRREVEIEGSEEAGLNSIWALIRAVTPPMLLSLMAWSRGSHGNAGISRA